MLYFSNITYNMIILFVLSLITIHKTLSNYQATNCDVYANTSYPCQTDFLHLVSIGNYGVNFDYIETVRFAIDPKGALRAILRGAVLHDCSLQA